MFIGVFAPLVARAGVLADVDAALVAARSGRGALLLVTGEAGIGKTRLSQEAADRAAGFEVIWTWCPAATSGAALGPWAGVTRALAGADPAAAGLARRSPFLASLAALGGSEPPARSPGQPDREPGQAGAHRSDLAVARAQLSLDLAELMRLAAAQRPLLVVIDDLHQADPSSLRLLADLAPALRAMPVLVLATARDGALEWQGQAGVRSELLRTAGVIELQPFEPEDISALLAATLGTASSPALVSVVAERSSGNPFLVTELTRLLGRHGADPETVRTMVPGPVRVIAADRVAELPGPARRLLQAAAILGLRFRLDVLAELADVPLGEISGMLADGSAAGLLTSGEPGAERFRHDLVRDAIYASIPPGTREELHGRAADVLAAFAERGRDADNSDVAYHLLRAGPAAAGRAAEYARRAGDQASEGLAFEDAVQWYERADASLAVASASDVARATVALELGSARVAAGDQDGGRDAFLRAAAQARRARRPDVLARAALGLGGGPAGFEVGLLDGDQISLLEEARTALSSALGGTTGSGPGEQAAGGPGADGTGSAHAALLALVTARLSIASTLIAPDSRRLELAAEAVGLARSAGDDAALAVTLAALCDALAGPDHCADRRAHATEIIEIAGRLHDPVLGLLGRRLRLVALLETGAIAVWDADVRAYRAVAEALRHPLYAWYVPLWRGMRALAEGRFADCRDALDQAAAIGKRAASANAEMLVVTQRWCLLADSGDPGGELPGLLARLEGADLGGVWPQVSRALALAQLGRGAEARAQLDAVAPLLASMPRDSEWLPALAQVAEIIASIGPHPLARWLYDVLSPYAGLFAVEGICAAIRGPVHRHLALLAGVLGDHEAAAGHRVAGIEAARSIGAVALAERIEHEASLAAGAPGPGTADPVLTRGDDPPIRPAPPGGGRDQLFRWDGEVWTLRYAGRQVRLRDSKGLRDLACLLARPGTAIAALDLAAATAGTGRARSAAPRAARSGPDGLYPPADTGELIDARARAAYRQRLRELEEAAEAADAAADSERSARIAVEREALVDALTQAYGLGGRARRAGSPAERARTAVTARVKDALRRISAAHPELGRHLTRSVRTGTFCAYEPEQPVRWSL